jgi:LacI family transcriptional regulator
MSIDYLKINRTLSVARKLRFVPSKDKNQSEIKLSSIGRARMSDVARLAGVSTKTASRVFSGDEKVAEKTKQAVLEAAARLRYRPNALARNLRTGAATKTVGLVIGDLGNPFYFKVAAAIERELAGAGMNLIVGTTEDSPEIEVQVVNAMLAQQVRALIIVPVAHDQSYLEGEQSLGTPLVFLDRKPVNLVADSICLSNYEGAKLATEELIAMGHKRIAFVAARPNLTTIAERLGGYQQAMLRAGISWDEDLERLPGISEEELEDAFRQLLSSKNPPTAIVGGNNRASVAFVKVSRELKKSCAYIGFDDFDLADALGISVVSFDIPEMGKQATKLAISKINNPGVKPRNLEVETVLILRGSENQHWLFGSAKSSKRS